MAQNPSPMTETVRAHTRLQQKDTAGERHKLALGELLLIGHLRKGATATLVVHFHGAPWVAEQAAASWQRRVAVLALQIGSGSGVYEKAFADPARFPALIAEAENVSGVKFKPIVLTSWSAGYGSIRAILRSAPPELLERIAGIVLADSLHTGYPGDKPGPPDPAPVESFVNFAREASAGRKHMVVTHSEVYPGTFASTTETAAMLAAGAGVKEKPVLRWGPLGMQQVMEARTGGLVVLGFAGNTAPDHVDHLHALGTWLRKLRVK